LAPCVARLEAKVTERTAEDLRGLITELVAVGDSGVDPLSTLQQPEMQKLWSIFSHQKLDLADIITKVATVLLRADGLKMYALCAMQCRWVHHPVATRNCVHQQQEQVVQNHTHLHRQHVPGFTRVSETLHCAVLALWLSLVALLPPCFAWELTLLLPLCAQARNEALDSKMEGMIMSADEITRGALIGKGGYASVFKGTLKGTEEVAIKCIKLVGPMMVRDQMDVKREAYIHKQAHDHPNICKLRGVIFSSADSELMRMQANDEFVLVLELLQGDLGQYLRGARGEILPQPERLKLALDVATGMAHLHSKNIIHGDLKPGNLLIRESAELGQVQVVVSDFGLSSISCVTLCSATMAAQVMQSSSTGLTLWYSPPELLANCISKKAKAGDVYALGIILFEILTGQHPYIVSQYDVVLKNVMEGRRPVLPEGVQLPRGCQELMSSCWNADPAARPSFDEIKRRLGAAMAACAVKEG
jgi:hypothetical protein